MYSVKVCGFNTEEEARQFIQWYEGQAEQDIDIWLECRRNEGLIETTGMLTDVKKTYPITFVDNQAELHINCSYRKEF